MDGEWSNATRLRVITTDKCFIKERERGDGDEPVLLCLVRFLTAVMRERNDHKMFGLMRLAERLHESVDGDSDDSEIEWHTTGSG
jgi:hypothetical protein